jgi:sortase A
MRRRRRQSRWAPVLGFAASVLMVTGVLLVADAVLTLTWQEPLSSFLANRQQHKLEDALANPPQRVILREPLKGDAIGKISLPTQDRSYFVVEGTDTASLRKGPGHYPDTPLPGQRGTVAIAGHRTTYMAPFRKIDKLKKGDPVIVDTLDGRYVYRTYKTRIVDPSQTEVKRRVGFDQLILSACHPPYSAAERIVVFARFVKREPPRLKKA